LVYPVRRGCLRSERSLAERRERRDESSDLSDAALESKFGEVDARERDLIAEPRVR
jgi:hypothetical protein